ncbi:hypothetical protein LX77_00233 [Gelidibacter algens]|uniref:PAS domain-containing protein n=1 Tax=Gelidibacter algens TaxID=49280 RepID=A0A1A7R2K7_9FLAO|nr:hypothetical protein A9996_07075 [Gelidibacter algens]RAJ27659.1 hypothetical protein LX77_00233 [Gelidibacter algens]
MTEQDSINQIFFKFLSQYNFDEKDLDYSILDKHKVALQALSSVSNSGINVFDICQRQVAFFSSNFGTLLGYIPSDYEELGQQFFADKLHPEDKLKLSLQGILHCLRDGHQQQERIECPDGKALRCPTGNRLVFYAESEDGDGEQPAVPTVGNCPCG